MAIAVPATASYDLETCYRAALKRSETMAIQEELITQAEERYSQASGSLFPTINGVGAYTRYDTPPSAENAFTRARRPEVRVTASQPIFRGLREYAGIRQRRLEAEAEREAKARAAVTLYADVAQAFYTVLTLESDLRETSTEIQLNEQRVKELKARRAIGRSRESEVLTMQTSVADLEAEADSVRGRLAAARESLAFLTGLERDAALADAEQAVPPPPPLAELVERVEQRPDVRAAARRVEVSEESVAVARGGHLPSIDVTGNYYLKRVGILEDQKWDVQGVLTLPLFAGGTLQSQLREATSRHRQAELDLSAARRQAEQELRSLHQNVQSDRSQVEALVRASELAERNYREQTREYRLGLVTNLDVLQALSSYQDTRRSLSQARFAAKLDFARLEAAAALRPAQ